MEKDKQVVLQIRNIRKDFGQRTVLKDVNFNVHKGEVVSIIGSSGSGKSTLLRCINLLEKPTSGEIIFHDKDVVKNEISLVKLREKVGMVFQSFNLFNNLNVLENCVIGQMKVLKRNREEAEKVAKELLAKVGMERFIKAKPNQLSGGQKQRVAIARALINDPEILLADEPTGNLDSDTSDIINGLFKKINEEKGQSIIIVTHSIELANMAKKQYVIKNGEFKLL